MGRAAQAALKRTCERLGDGALLNNRRAPRIAQRITKTAVTRKIASRARNIAGYCTASHPPPRTSTSSPSESATLENGSGEVLAAARAPALEKWVAAVTDPPSKAAASAMPAPESPNTPAASAAPAGILTKVCSPSQTLSSQGSLSANISTAAIKPAAPITSGLATRCRCSGSGSQPKYPARPSAMTTRYRRSPAPHESAPANASSGRCCARVSIISS
jgi:hypothetical protein